MRRLACLAMFYTLTMTPILSAATAVAAEHSSEHDKVMATLQGYEWQLDLAVLRALPAGAWRDLLAVVDDNTQAGFVRERAAASLAAFPNDEVLAGRQVESLCMGFASQRPLVVEQALLPLLEETEGQLRLPAARCLQAMDLPSSQPALARYRGQVANTWEARALSHASAQALSL
jgi:hypothetical protein